MNVQRAPLSPESQAARPLALSALARMRQALPQAYASVYFERKATRTVSVNPKQTQVGDQVSMGLVLRLYDGFTLFEQATDDLEPASLGRFVDEFCARVRSTPPPAGAQARPYAGASWKERLSQDLDAEIVSQVPADPSPEQPLHFGVRFEIDPLAPPLSAHVERLQGALAKCRAAATQAGLAESDLSYLMARQALATEEAIFIDSQVHLSQTIYRASLTLVAMSGADRTFERSGGLGGLEAVEVSEREILRMMTDLKRLKSADRLKPGKHRVLFGPVISGILAHEAFGHSQEADTCARGRSKAWDLYHSGQTVGNQHATILNNPAIFRNGTDSFAAWGSYFFDEEGWFAREQVLLDQGKLQAPMTNLTSALRLGVPRTANGKRESWANGVYTRQTNTYFSPGDKTLPQLIEQLGDGYLALSPAGGMEDPKGMGIQVGISFLHEVRGGKLTGKVLRGPAGGDIQMTGYTPDVLNSIEAKGKIEADSSAPDTARHPLNDVGGCGKYHKEFVFAGCGGPYMLMNNVTLG